MSSGGAAGGCPLRNRGCADCAGIGNTCDGGGAAHKVALEPEESNAGCTKVGATVTSCGGCGAVAMSANCKRAEGSDGYI
eukprot:5454888-Amphidinium_carterae.2